MLALAALLAALWPGGAPRAQPVQVFTTEYPPYASTGLPGQGAAVRMLAEMLAEHGFQARVDFMPWARLGRELAGGRYDIVFLAWPGDIEAHGLLGGAPWFLSRVGFYVRRDMHRPEGLDTAALRGRTVGLVRDYAYPPSLMALGILPDYGSDDAQNLRKLAAGRFDYVALERAVGEHLLASGAIGAQLLVWQEPAVAELPIYAAVVPGREFSAELRQLLDEGLARFKRDGRYQRLLRRHRLDAP